MLPKWKRSNNINPFSFSDLAYLENLKNDVFKQLKRYFEFFNTKIQSIECNITQRLENTANISAVIDLISNAVHFSQKNKKKDFCKYVKLDGLTPTTTSAQPERKNYWRLKIYDKSHEQGLKNIKLLRIEFVFSGRSLKKVFSEKDLCLENLLTKENLSKVLVLYKETFTKELLPMINNYLNACVLNIKSSLINQDKFSLDALIAENKLIIFDKEILKRALKKYYLYSGKADHSKRDTERLVKRYKLPCGTLETIKKFHLACG